MAPNDAVGDAPGEMDTLPYVSIPPAEGRGNDACRVGWYSVTGRKPCAVCPPGTMCPLPGMTGYLACGVNEYNTLTRSTSCRPCPAEMVCENGSRPPRHCLNGLIAGINIIASSYVRIYNIFIADSDQRSCLPCFGGRRCKPHVVRAFAGSIGVVVDGSAYLWGGAYDFPSPVQIPTGTNTTAIVADLVSNEAGSVCGIFSSGEMYCWGRSFIDSSQRGRENPLRFNPVSSPVTHISLSSDGSSSACVVTANGQVMCFDPYASELGDRLTFAPRFALDFGEYVRKTVVSRNQVYALLTTGHVRYGSGWGASDVSIPGSGVVKDMALFGDSGGVCFIVDNSMYCSTWAMYPEIAIHFIGRTPVQIGLPTTSCYDPTPYFCVLLDDGSIVCLEKSTVLVLCRGNNNQVTVTELPLVFSDTIPGIQVSTSRNVACAMFANLRVRCKTV